MRKRLLRAVGLAAMLVTVGIPAYAQNCHTAAQLYSVQGQELANRIGDEMSFRSTLDNDLGDLTQEYGFALERVALARNAELAVGAMVRCGPFEARGFSFSTGSAFRDLLMSNETLRWFRVRRSNLLPVLNEENCDRLGIGRPGNGNQCASPVRLFVSDDVDIHEGRVGLRWPAGSVGVFVGVYVGRVNYQRAEIMEQRAIYDARVKFCAGNPCEIVIDQTIEFENDITLDWQTRSNTTLLGPDLGLAVKAGDVFWLRGSADMALVRTFRNDRDLFRDTDAIRERLTDNLNDRVILDREVLLDGTVDTRLDRNAWGWVGALGALAGVRLGPVAVGLGAFANHRSPPLARRLVDGWGLTDSGRAPRGLEIEDTPGSTLAGFMAEFSLETP